MDQGNPKTWEAVLTPHRSLSRTGFILVMALVAGVNLAMGIMFFAMGAWPVAGFLGLDVLILWLAFRANFAGGRQAERIVITEHELILQRRLQDGAEDEQRFVRRWVRVDLEEDKDRELIGGLHLCSRGARTAIGAFLPPEERKEFARHLKAALAIPRI